MKAALTLIAVALAGLGISACGGDGDDGEDSLSKTEFLAEANRICAEGGAKVEAAFGELGGQPTQRQAEQVISEVGLPTIEEDIEKIRALGLPEGDEDEVNQMLDDSLRIVDGAKTDISSFFADEQGKDPWRNVDRRMASYGLTACAEA